MKSLRKTLNESIAKTGVKGLCSYAVRWEKGERLQINDVCYARAKWDEYHDYDYNTRQPLRKGNITEVVASLTPSKKYNPSSNMKKWASYIIQRSPFKECFLTQNLSAAWRYGVQVDVNKTVGPVIASLIALREGWEFPYIAKNFAMFTRAGISEDVAFLLSRFVKPYKGGYVGAGFGGHQSIGTDKLENLKLFLENGLKPVGVVLKDNPKTYKVFQSTWSDVPLDGKGQNIKALLFKGNKKTIGVGWNAIEIVSKKVLINNAKQIEELFK